MVSKAAFLDAIPLPTIIVGSDNRIAAANHAAETLFGQGMIGRPYVTMLRQPVIQNCVDDTLQTKAPRNTQVQITADAQDLTFKLSSRYVDIFGSQTGGFAVLCFEDTSPLEQANQMRRDFVANVSHELRTPLTAMMGFIETLQGPAKEDAKARKRFLAIMASEASRMNRLVGDLLSLSRVEELQRQRPTDQVNLSDTLSNTVQGLSQLAQDNAVQVQLELPDTPVILPADADQLQQVFTNLIENALKYAGSGDTLDIIVQMQDLDPVLRGPAVQVQIVDHGPGIAPHHIARLTERFYRADTHRSREMGGTGLGLAIVKHIITRHRGRLKVESTLGQGSTFTVVLPL